MAAEAETAVNLERPRIHVRGVRKSFAGRTVVDVADTVFGEAPIEGFDADALVEGLGTRGHRGARSLAGPEELASGGSEVAEPGDYVIFLGAGSISQWAYDLPAQLAAGGRDN